MADYSDSMVVSPGGIQPDLLPVAMSPNRLIRHQIQAATDYFASRRKKPG